MRIIPINDVFLGANDWANAHSTGAKITPDQFNRIVVDETYNFVGWLYGLPNQYQPGSPVPAITAEETQLVVDYLERLKVSDFKMNIDISGKGTIPEDYIHVYAIRYLYSKKGDADLPDAHICDDDCHDPCLEKAKSVSFTVRNRPKYTLNHRPVKILKEAQFQFALCSVNRPATKEYPVCVFRSGHVQYAPQDLKEVLFTYLRYPKKPVFNYDITDEGDVVFVPVGSQDIELPLIMSKYVSAMVATRMGFYNRDMPLINIGQNMKKEGI